MFSTRVPTISPGMRPNLSIFRGVMAFFLISQKLRIALTVCFFFSAAPARLLVFIDKKVAPKFQHLTLRFTLRRNGLSSARNAGWTSSYLFFTKTPPSMKKHNLREMDFVIMASEFSMPLLKAKLTKFRWNKIEIFSASRTSAR